jgi:hypothetical protein
VAQLQLGNADPGLDLSSVSAQAFGLLEILFGFDELAA